VFNVYRDNVLLTATPISTLSFTDTNLANGVYVYGVTVVYSLGESIPAFYTVIVEVEEEPEEVTSTELFSNFPNPFNVETVIRFTLLKDEFVTIGIYNIRGQRVRSLLDGSHEFGTGVHNVRWDGTDDNGRTVSSGIYLYRMRAGEYQSVRRMLLMK